MSLLKPKIPHICAMPREPTEIVTFVASSRSKIRIVRLHRIGRSKVFGFVEGQYERDSGQ